MESDWSDDTHKMNVIQIQSHSEVRPIVYTAVQWMPVARIQKGEMPLTFEHFQLLLTWTAVESQTEFWNLHTWAVNMDKASSKALKWTVKCLDHELLAGAKLIIKLT